MLKFQRLIIAVSLAALIVSSQRAFGQFDELIGRVPDSANAVALTAPPLTGETRHRVFPIPSTTEELAREVLLDAGSNGSQDDQGGRGMTSELAYHAEIEADRPFDRRQG